MKKSPFAAELNMLRTRNMRPPYMSMEELGRRAGVSAAFISHLELDKKAPTLKMCCALARALDVPPTRLALLSGRIPPALLADLLGEDKVI